MNPFTDQWPDTPPVNSNPPPSLSIPIDTSSATQQPISTNSTTDQFKNVNTNQANIQSSNFNGNQKPNSLLIRILNEIFNNYEMVTCKLFYFLFYSAFGSLFPLIGIYFKQQALSATETGILIGCRYIVEIFSAPFWANLADRFNKGKTILILSLVSWILLTSALAFIRPPAVACVSFNGTSFILYEPYLEDISSNLNENTVNIRNRREILDNKELTEKLSYFKTGISQYSIYEKKYKEKLEQQQTELPPYMQKYDQQMRLPPNHVIGKSPSSVEYAVNYDSELHSDYISPPFSHIVYKKSEKDEVFILLLLLILIGEFFAAPTTYLVDTVTIRQLNNNLNNYCKQRMFGSVGWAIAMLLIGIALDNSKEFKNHPCGAHVQERNYNVCFKSFAVLMTFACFVATRFNFDIKECENETDQNVESNELDRRDQANQTNAQANQTHQANENSTFSNGNDKKHKFELLDQLKSGVFAQRLNRQLEWISLFKSKPNIKLIALIVLAWFFGSSVGLVFSFLFWHLQDLGGSPTLFGIASVINHISEIAAYFHSLHYIKKYGHTRVLTLALFCNFLRFLYISYIDNPWLILPFELVQGITHATVWATFCSFLNYLTDSESSKKSTQAILQIVYSGFGKGCGSIIGGFLISTYGTRTTFAIYAFSSLIAICLFIFIMNIYNRQLRTTVNLGEQSSGRNRQKWLDDDLNKGSLAVNENEYVTGGLSPHGVPTAPINRQPTKTAQSTSSNKTRIEPPINYNDDNKLDEYITKNHREWRITRNYYK